MSRPRRPWPRPSRGVAAGLTWPSPRSAPESGRRPTPPSSRRRHPHQRCRHPGRRLGPDAALLRGARPADAVAVHAGRRAPLHARRPGPPGAHPRAARGARDEPRRDPRVPRPRDAGSTSCGRRYRATRDATSQKALAEQKATLQEALVLNESLAEQISAKLARMDGFRAKLRSDARALPGAPGRVGLAARPRETARGVRTLVPCPTTRTWRSASGRSSATQRGLSEKKMFGGVAFLIGGNLAVAASGQGGILVRVGPSARTSWSATTQATVAVMGGRPMAGWLRVAATDLRTNRQLGQVGRPRGRRRPGRCRRREVRPPPWRRDPFVTHTTDTQHRRRRAGASAAWFRAKDPGLLVHQALGQGGRRHAGGVRRDPRRASRTHRSRCSARSAPSHCCCSSSSPGRPARAAHLLPRACFVVGACFTVLGTPVSTHKVAAVVTMAVVGFAVLFAGIVAPQAATATTAALLTFVLPVAVAQPASAIGPRLLGWTMAGVVCIAACMLVLAASLARQPAPPACRPPSRPLPGWPRRAPQAADARRGRRRRGLRARAVCAANSPGRPIRRRVPRPTPSPSPSSWAGSSGWPATRPLIGDEPWSGDAASPARKVTEKVAETLRQAAALICDGERPPGRRSGPHQRGPQESHHDARSADRCGARGGRALADRGRDGARAGPGTFRTTRQRTGACRLRSIRDSTPGRWASPPRWWPTPRSRRRAPSRWSTAAWG